MAGDPAFELDPEVALALALTSGLVVAVVLCLLLRRYTNLLSFSPATTIQPEEKADGSDLLEVVVHEHLADASKDTPLDVTATVAERPIGSGGQGGVWLAYDRTSGKRFALKQLRKGRLAALKRVGNVKPESCQWLIEREALLKCGGHPFITTCYATFQDDQSLFYALELASGGDLFSRLHTSELGQLPEDQSQFYIACVGLALKHIHSCGFLYCDIKLENVLITNDGYVKLCDFGLAKKLGGGTKRCSIFGNRNGDRSFSKCGTDQYAPPEVVQGNGRSKSADWWALGVLLHEMLTGHSPFEGKGMAAIFARVEEYATGGVAAMQQLRMEVTEDASDLSDAGADFLLGLLTPSERDRFGCGGGGFAVSVQAHPWFASFDWVALLRQQLPAPWVPPQATATDKRGSHAPTAEEVRQEVAALFNEKNGVLRERPFEAQVWQHLFEPFGSTVPRVINGPERRDAESCSSDVGATPEPTSAVGGTPSLTPATVLPSDASTVPVDAVIDEAETTSSVSVNDGASMAGGDQQGSQLDV